MSMDGSHYSENLNSQLQPTADRPVIPEYGIPETLEGILPWEHVIERMKSALNYWIATASPDGRPHATPVWGVWLDGQFYFDGSPRTRRGRNLAKNSAVTVHLESGNDVIILQGDAHEIHGPDNDLAVKLAATYASKYADRGYEPAPDT